MPDLICPDHATLAYLEALETRLRAILPQAGGTHVWAPLRRVVVDLQQEIANGWAGLDEAAEEMMAADLREKENDYHAEEAEGKADLYA